MVKKAVKLHAACGFGVCGGGRAVGSTRRAGTCSRKGAHEKPQAPVHRSLHPRAGTPGQLTTAGSVTGKHPCANRRGLHTSTDFKPTTGLLPSFLFSSVLPQSVRTIRSRVVAVHDPRRRPLSWAPSRAADTSPHTTLLLARQGQSRTKEKGDTRRLSPASSHAFPFPGPHASSCPSLAAVHFFFLAHEMGKGDKQKEEAAKTAQASRLKLH